MNDILFASIDLPILNKEQATIDIMSIDQRYWWWDEYRNTSMLPLMTKGGRIGQDGANNRFRNEPFEWTDYAPSVLTEWMDDVVFPWMKMRTRVSALMTKAHAANKEHIDCDPHNMGTNQNKFRIVLKGKTETLYFITKNGNVPVPSVDGCFIMDGSWPHGMDNSTDDYKLTIALGAPWNGNDFYNNANILMKRSQHRMPEDFNKYFDPRILRKKQ